MLRQHKSSRQTVPDQTSRDQRVSTQEMVNRLSDTLYRHGLRLPALIALEAGRPLTFLGGQLLWIAQPALSLFLPSQTIEKVAHLLEEPAAIQALMEQLETKES